MIIKLDVREQDLIFACQRLVNTMQCFKDLILIKESLPLGDAIICDVKEENKEKIMNTSSESISLGGNGTNSENLIEKVIIERKTLRDLSSSIKDGRYEEQSYRLSGIPHPNHNIVYLVEGNMDKFNIFKGHDNKMMLYSAMVSLNYFKGFSVIRSASIDESALIICNYAYKIGKSEREHKKPYYKASSTVTNPSPVLTESTTTREVATENTTATIEPVPSAQVALLTYDATEATEAKEETQDEYCSVVKKVKKDNITPDNIGAIFLCQIPSISSVTASAIMSKYKTLAQLIESVKADPLCLQTVTYTTPTGQTRKISKPCIDNIRKFLIA